MKVSGTPIIRQQSAARISTVAVGVSPAVEGGILPPGKTVPQTTPFLSPEIRRALGIRAPI